MAVAPEIPPELTSAKAPIAVLVLPVILVSRLLYPKAVFSFPVLALSDKLPLAVFSWPVTLLYKDWKPVDLANINYDSMDMVDVSILVLSKFTNPRTLYTCLSKTRQYVILLTSKVELNKAMENPLKLPRETHWSWTKEHVDPFKKSKSSHKEDNNVRTEVIADEAEEGEEKDDDEEKQEIAPLIEDQAQVNSDTSDLVDPFLDPSLTCDLELIFEYTDYHKKQKM